MAQIFNGSVYGGSPGISTTVNYEYTRDGANMKYHFWGNTRLSNSNGWYYNNVRVKLYLNGSDIYTKDCKSSSKGWSIDWDAGWHTVSNKTSGTTPFYFTVKDTQNSGWCNYTSGTYQLDVAPAYTSITGFSVRALSETSVRFNWSASNTVDYVWYSTNNGSSWTGVDVADGASGSFDVGGLAANTGYNFKIRVRRRDSQLTTDSGAYYATTYAYPYLTSVPEFTVGNSLTIGIYNPLGRSCTISVIGDNGTEYTGGTITGTNISGFNNSGWLNNWYATLPSKTSGTYKARLVCSTGNVNKVSNAVKYYLDTSDSGFKPSFTANEIINVVNTANTAIAGSNKFIKNHNSLSGVIKPMTAKRSARGSYYNVSSSGLSTVKKDYSSSNINFVLGNMSTNTFNITAVDSRGFTTTVSKTIDLVDYNEPSVTSYKITRQNGIGTKAILSFSGKYTNWSGLLKSNAIQSIKYKIGSSESWKNLPSDATLTNSNGTWTLNAILVDEFSVTSQYDLYLQITDLLETVTTKAYTISTADAFIWKDLANKRMGIGKKPEYSLDVNGDINTNGNFRINGKSIVSSGVITSEVGCVGKTYYYHICHIKKLSHIQGNMYGIRLYEGTANNGNPNQNTYTEIVFQDGWIGSNSGRPGVTCEYHNLLTSTYTREIIVTYSDNYNYDVWVKGIGDYTRPNYIPMYNPKYIEITDTSKDGSETPPSDTNKLNVSIINSSLSSYPVGSVYISATATSPASLFGGTWTQLKNRFLFATNSTSGNKGKDAVSSHTGTNVTGTAISINQMPAHTHNAGLNNAGGHIHNFWFGGGANSGNGGQIPVANSRWGQGNAGQTNGAHDHGGVWVANSGGGQAHNHSISYIEVYVWQRTK